jgi:hypothetical protein
MIERLAGRSRSSQGTQAPKVQQITTPIAARISCAPSALTDFFTAYLGLADSSGSRRTKFFQRFAPRETTAKFHIKTKF